MTPHSEDLLFLLAPLIVLAGAIVALVICRFVYVRWRDRQRLSELARRDRVRQEHPELGHGRADDY